MSRPRCDTTGATRRSAEVRGTMDQFVPLSDVRDVRCEGYVPMKAMTASAMRTLLSCFMEFTRIINSSRAAPPHVRPHTSTISVTSIRFYAASAA